MALLTLTPESIKKICESASGQEAIAKLAQEMNRQGITKMFIDYEKVRALVKRMEKMGSVKILLLTSLMRHSTRF